MSWRRRRQWVKKLEKRRELYKKKSGSESGVHSTDFYDLLGVTPDATSAEIKREYLKKARLLHPDKNPDDPGAKDRFQKLGEAYQVLSDDDQRARYDAKGLDGLDQTAFMEASTMYAMLFGSEKFDDLIGELAIASMLQQAEASSGEGMDPSLKHLSHKQRQRKVTCAVKLAERLQQFADGEVDMAAFEKDARTQAAELCTTAFGEILTHTIGRVYVYKASQALGWRIDESMRMKGHVWGNNAKALKAMISMYQASRAAQVASLEARTHAQAPTTVAPAPARRRSTECRAVP